jgi:hypothetical protein
MKSTPLASNAERSHRVAVVVGEQGEVEVKRLRPSDMAPRGVARGRNGADADLL